jgi:hypothetical protein
MTEHDDRWYDAYLPSDLKEFDDALMTAFRPSNPARYMSPDDRRLFELIAEHGGLHKRGTWLCIMPEGPTGITVHIRHRQPDGAYETRHLSAPETRELVSL